MGYYVGIIIKDLKDFKTKILGKYVLGIYSLDVVGACKEHVEPVNAHAPACPGGRPYPTKVQNFSSTNWVLSYPAALF